MSDEITQLVRRAALAAKIGTWNTIRLQEIITEIERENFENQAGYLKNFVPWSELKDILGMLIDE